MLAMNQDHGSYSSKVISKEGYVCYLEFFFCHNFCMYILHFISVFCNITEAGIASLANSLPQNKEKEKNY